MECFSPAKMAEIISRRIVEKVAATSGNLKGTYKRFLREAAGWSLVGTKQTGLGMGNLYKMVEIRTRVFIDTLRFLCLFSAS